MKQMTRYIKELSIIFIINVAFNHGMTNAQTCTLNLIANISNVSCYGSADGMINLSVSNGLPPYSYNWSNGSTTEDLLGLDGGNYSVTVVDYSGCSVTASFVVVEPDSISVNAMLTNASAPGQSDGAINLSVWGGTNNSCVNLFITIITDAFGEETHWNIIDSATMAVLDTGGGYLGNSIYYDTICVPSNMPLTFNVFDDFGDGMCCTYGNGSYSLSYDGLVLASGGVFGFLESTDFLASSLNTAVYHYNWSTGDTIQDISNLPVGNYSVTISDDNGCQAIRSYSISSPCDSIDSLYATRVTVNSARLMWTPSPTADHYQIRGRRVGNSNWVYITVNGNSYHKDVYGLINNTSYEWQVKAFCDPAEVSSSIWSPLNVFTTGCFNPDSIWTSAITSTAATFNWTKVVGAAGYQIMARKSGGAWNSIIINNNNTTSKTVNILKPGKTYDWAMKTYCDNQGNKISAYTSIISFTTLTSNKIGNNQMKYDDDEENFEFYPNPAQGHITLDFGKAENSSRTISLLDDRGRQVLSLAIKGTVERQRIALPKLSNGIYQLIVKDAGRVVNRKLVIAQASGTSSSASSSVSSSR